MLWKMTWSIWQIFVHRLKNLDFILEIKISELNQSKKSKQPDRPDAVWKLVLHWKKMNKTISKTFCTCSTKSLFLRCNKISKKAVMLGSFLHCSVHIFLEHDGWGFDFWYVLESIQKILIELHVLQCLFIRGRTKNKAVVGLFQISQKKRLLELLGAISKFGLPSSEKAFLSLSFCSRVEYT